MPAWKSFGGLGRSRGRGRGDQPGRGTHPPKEQHSINDNYCIVNPEPLARSVDCVLNVQRQDFSVTVQSPVLCPVVSPVHIVQERQSQKKGISPSLKTKRKINFSKWKLRKPSGSPSFKGNGSPRWISVTHISTFLSIQDLRNSSGFISKTRLPSSRPYPLASPQLLWSSPAWSKR